MEQSYAELPNGVVGAANGISYAYRDTGGHDGAVPVVLLQHFRGNLDSWDPALVDALARSRRVITFDNAGVGGSTGTTPDTIEQMARDAIAFVTALGVGQVDLLGFSIGSFVAQEIALRRPALVRRLVLASSAPQGAAGMHGWTPAVIGAVGTPQTSQEEYLGVFFAASEASQQAGKEALGRMYARKEDRDEATSGHPRGAVRRCVRLGDPRPRGARAGERHRDAGARRQRRQRPDDRAALLLPAGRPDPAGPAEDLPGLGARVPLPAPRRVRRRLDGIPGLSRRSKHPFGS
jgi:pimeloyl-ACP methyl ester carboxylesterase